MHGYELIGEMSERSGGRWEPSPGTIYPALNRMEARGLIEAEEVDGKRRFTLTPDGKRRAAETLEARGGDAAPWGDPGTGRRGELRGKVAELVGQVRQIGKFGTPEQAEAAGKVLDDAKRKLYAILAAEPAEGGFVERAGSRRLSSPRARATRTRWPSGESSPSRSKPRAPRVRTET